MALVYDVTDAKSFQAISGWAQSLDQHASRQVCKVLVANKCDRDDRRVISTEEGQKLAAENGFRYFETSAKTGLHVEDMFMKLAREVKHRDIDPIFGAAQQLEGDDLDTKKKRDGIIELEPPSKKNIFQACCSS